MIHIAVWDHPSSDAFCGLYSSQCADMAYVTASPRGVCKPCIVGMKQHGEDRVHAALMRAEQPPKGRHPVPFCSQCGKSYNARACGPTHAMLQWERRPPKGKPRRKR